MTVGRKSNFGTLKSDIPCNSSEKTDSKKMLKESYNNGNNLPMGTIRKRR